MAKSKSKSKAKLEEENLEEDMDMEEVDVPEETDEVADEDQEILDPEEDMELDEDADVPEETDDLAEDELPEEEDDLPDAEDDLEEDDLPDAADNLEEDDLPEDVDDLADKQADDDGEATGGDKEASGTDIARPPGLPKPQMTKTAMVFMLLNWVMVAAFVYVATMDYFTRLQFSYRGMLNHITIWGLPLRMEEDFPSGWAQTRPQLKLSPEQLKDAFKSRRGVTPIGAREEFVPVDEPVPLRLRPSDMSEDILKDVFAEVGKAMGPTQEDEIVFLITDVPSKIENATKTVLDKFKDKSEEEKRKTAKEVLLPFAWNVWQDEKLAKRIEEATGAELDSILKESVQRRMYHDILAPINLFRPPDLKDFKVEKLASLDSMPEAKDLKDHTKLEDLKKVLEKRFSAAIADKYNAETHLGDLWNTEKSGALAMERDSIEKRQTIAFVLCAVAHVQVPVLGDFLYPKGVERAQVLCGLREFTTATIHYVPILRVIEDRRERQIRDHRQGYVVDVRNKPETTMTKGYIDEHNAVIDELVDLVRQIDVERKRLETQRRDRDHLQKIYEQRALQHREVMDKLLTARKNTEVYVLELRKKQTELHEALVELSDAAERNFALEARIRHIEMDYLKKLEQQQKKKGKR